MNVFDQLKIICWNAKGLQAEKGDLTSFLHISDIILWKPQVSLHKLAKNS